MTRSLSIIRRRHRAARTLRGHAGGARRRPDARRRRAPRARRRPGAADDDLADTVDYGRVVDARARRRRGRRVPSAGAPRDGDRGRRLGRLDLVLLEVGRRRKPCAAGRIPVRRRPASRSVRDDRVSGAPPRSAASSSRSAPTSATARRTCAPRARRLPRCPRPPSWPRPASTRRRPRTSPTRPPFLNQVVCLETGAASRWTCCGECQRIEREHGRVRALRFGPRTLDIDILLFQDVESDDPSSRSRTRAWSSARSCSCRWPRSGAARRGMPDIDVAGLARATARTQQVRLYDATEG